MGLIKFITIYDDANNAVLTNDVCNYYNIATLPAFYRADTLPYYDTINTDSRKFFSQKNASAEMTEVCVPGNVFTLMLENACESGYVAAVIFCPHAKLSPYYAQAKKGAEAFLRRKKMLDSDFGVYIHNTRSFAAGMFHCVVDAVMSAPQFDFSAFASCLSNRYYTGTDSFVLSYNDEKGVFEEFAVSKTNVKQLPIVQYYDNVVFDIFAHSVADMLSKRGSKFAVSFSCDCDFLCNVLGRIESRLGVYPCSVMQYSIPTADIFGSKAICVHVL